MNLNALSVWLICFLIVVIINFTRVKKAQSKLIEAMNRNMDLYRQLYEIMVARQKIQATPASLLPKLTVPYSLITPARWKSSSDRVQWMRDLLTQGPFMDVLSILQSTAIQPPSQGFDPAYELGRVHGLQLAVRTMLSLSHPEEEPVRQPIADYNASTEANKAGVRLDDEAAQSALDGTYDDPVDPIA